MALKYDQSYGEEDVPRRFGEQQSFIDPFRRERGAIGMIMRMNLNLIPDQVFIIYIVYIVRIKSFETYKRISTRNPMSSEM